MKPIIVRQARASRMSLHHQLSHGEVRGLSAIGTDFFFQERSISGPTADLSRGNKSPTNKFQISCSAGVCRHFSNKPVGKRSPRPLSNGSKAPDNETVNPWLGVSKQKLEQETSRVIQWLREENSRNNRLHDFFHLLQAWEREAKKTGRIDAAQRAEELLETLEGCFLREDCNVSPPTLACYKLVLQAYEACSNKRQQVTIAERAVATLNFVLKHSQEHERLRPTTKFYNQVLSCLAKSRVKDAGLQAEAILSTMRCDGNKTSDDITYSCRPNSRTFVLVMNAWANSRNPKTAERVGEFLQRRVDQSMTADRDSNSPATVPLNLAIFHAALDAIVESIRDKPLRKHHLQTPGQLTAIQAAESVERFVQLLLDNSQTLQMQPTALTFSFALDAWARVEGMDQSGNAAQRAQAILDHIMGGYSHAMYSRAVVSVKPSTLCFTLTMLAWSRVQEPEVAEDLYHQMVDLYKSTGYDAELTPTAEAGNIVLGAWAKAGCLDRILMFFQAMHQFAKENELQECQPNLKSYNILLGAFAKAGKVEDAESLLRWLEGTQSSFASAGIVLIDPKPKVLGKPDIVSYNNVMTAFAKQGDANGAEVLLNHMKLGYVLPDQDTYTSVLNAYARSDDPRKVQKARSLVQEAAMNHTLDEVFSVALIQVCASALPTERKQGFDLASRVFESLDLRKRNHIAYLTMAKVINNLLVLESDQESGMSSKDRAAVEAERMQLLKALARQCCESGCLSIMVQQELERNAKNSADNVQAWLKCGSLRLEWSRNVPPNQRPTSNIHDR